MMIIRAHELKKGDLYIKQGVRYKVVKVDSDGIHYKPDTNGGGETGRIGAKSQERVELINKDDR